ncbi:MAG: PAS domain-containing protein [Myxococcales bacterium]|nr:PAS domain-containing protein [Myxococcales bacterium]
MPNEASPDRIVPPSYVVGVGASAGGLEALEQLFRHVSPSTGMAFVIIQHLSPDFRSQMDELMGRWTTMTVRVAANEMPLAANTIYLIPPNAELIVSDQRLVLSERGEGIPLPIDLFLRSLANDLGRRAVAVVLSGTGSDGSRGVRAVHDAGGLVLVQDERTARFDGMPRSAIETGTVDEVLGPAELAAALERHSVRPPTDLDDSRDPEGAVREGGMHAVFGLLRDRYGIDFSCYKPGTIRRRTERRIQLGDTKDLSAYIDLLHVDRGELDALYHDLLIGVTEFFRDAETFEWLEREVMPRLVQEAKSGHELRLWVAGCATGEEAYSMAILLSEAISRMGRSIPAKIFATDVHRPSLDTASAGLYPEAALTALSPERRQRYFTREAKGFRVTAELRRMIVFAPHNIIRDAPFTKLDMVSCRNLLIYLQPTIQRKVLSLFHFGLRKGGVLLLGPSESPGDILEEFETLDSQRRIYRKRRDIRLLPGLRGMPPAPGLPPMTGLGTVRIAGSSDGHLVDVFSSLLEQSLPPSVLLDQDRRIVHSFGDVASLLRLPRGRPSLSVLDMLDGELKLAVAGALHRASLAKEPISFSGVRASSSIGERFLDVHVDPVEVPHFPEPFFLLSLRDVAEPGRAVVSHETVDIGAISHDRLEALELELRHTKESLQATIEELEASNEELQATNEELLASNEELQSTNEELHSVNEELYTVNAEYQRKIDQLTELTDDMDNLLLSTEVHTLFVDEELRIRKFTPAIAQTFNLVESDVGRRIETFAHDLTFEGLGDVLTRTLNSGQRFEQEVSTRSGTAYLMRVVPYRGQRTHQGVVLTLIDITELRRVELALREQVKLRDQFLAMLSHELRNPLAAINNSLTLIRRRGPLADAVATPLSIIERQSRHMQRLLDDLLDVSRVTQGKIRLRREVFDVVALARDLAQQTRPTVEKREQTLVVELSDEPVWVSGDPARVLQVIDNLLSNAIKYTAEGGHLTLRVSRDERRVKIVVQDDGAGLDEETRARIFEMFVQADTTLDRSNGGLGVGLTLVHELVALHGGEIEVESPGPGRGSTFTVWLPGVDEPAVREGAPATGSKASGIKLSPLSAKLVLVEDRAELRDSLAELLKDEGYEVVTAADGNEGLDTIVRERPGGALLDIGLPGIDGYEVARRLRARADTANVVLVAMTGYGTEEDSVRVRDAGFDAHIVKPFLIEDVVQQLHELGLAVAP